MLILLWSVWWMFCDQQFGNYLFLKGFHVVLYTALENHVPLQRFPETFSMWYRIIIETKWHRVQPLYCINTPDYNQDIRYVLDKCNFRSCPGITKASGPVTWWHVCQNWFLLAANENLSHSFTGTYVHRALQNCLRLKYHYILPVSTNNISGTRHKSSYSKLSFMMATLNG